MSAVHLSADSDYFMQGFGPAATKALKRLLPVYVAQLPEKERDCLLDTYVRNLSYADQAKALGMPRSTVMRRHDRALQKLRERFLAKDNTDQGHGNVVALQEVTMSKTHTKTCRKRDARAREVLAKLARLDDQELGMVIERALRRSATMSVQELVRASA
jgi:hypothetical protein